MRNILPVRIVALLLAVVITASVTAGCSRGNSQSGAVGTTGSSTDVGSNENSNTNGDKDMYSAIKGTTVSVVSWAEADERTKAVIKAFEEHYDCKVDYQVYGWADWQSKIYQMVSAGNPPDQLIINDAQFFSYVAMGIAQPVDQYFDISDPIWNKSVCDLFSWSGKHYGVSLQNEDYIMYVYYNKDMFEENGIKTPLEYYNEGKWNWETFREVARKLSRDTNKDGKMDQRGFSAWYFDLFTLANGGGEIKLNTDGTITSTMKNENEIKGFQMIQDLQQVDKSYDISENNWLDDFKSGKVAMIAERPWQAMAERKMYENCKFEIEVAPFPKGPDAPDDIAPGMVYSWGIPVGAKNPLGAIAWYYFGAKIYGPAHEKDELSIAERNRFYKDEETYAFIKEYNKTHKVSATFIYGLPSMWDKRWQFWNELLNDGLPVSTAIDKFQPTIDSAIKQVENAFKQTDSTSGNQ